MAVTPVRISCPSIFVTYPTSTPGISVIALCAPDFPGKTIPSALARGRPDGDVLLNLGTQSEFCHLADLLIPKLAPGLELLTLAMALR